MKTMILAGAMVGWSAGCLAPAWAADPPPVIQATDLMTIPPAAAPVKSPPASQPPASAPATTNTLHTLSSHAPAPGGPTATNAVAEPVDQAALSTTAGATSRATQKPKSPVTRRKYGGLVHDLFTTRSGYKLLNPFRAVPEEQEDNTVYDPVTGKPSGVGLFKIHWGDK